MSRPGSRDCSPVGGTFCACAVGAGGNGRINAIAKATGKVQSSLTVLELVPTKDGKRADPEHAQCGFSGGSSRALKKRASDRYAGAETPLAASEVTVRPQAPQAAVTTYAAAPKTLYPTGGYCPTQLLWPSERSVFPSFSPREPGAKSRDPTPLRCSSLTHLSSALEAERSRRNGGKSRTFPLCMRLFRSSGGTGRNSPEGAE